MTIKEKLPRACALLISCSLAIKVISPCFGIAPVKTAEAAPNSEYSSGAPRSSDWDTPLDEGICSSAPKGTLYSKLTPHYSYLDMHVPVIGWSSPENADSSKGSGAVQLMAVPDESTRRIHWTLFMNPSSGPWQKPYVWFGVQRNIELVEDVPIRIRQYTNVNSFGTYNFVNDSIYPQDWDGHPNNLSLREFRRAPMDSTKGTTDTFGPLWRHGNVGSHLVYDPKFNDRFTKEIPRSAYPVHVNIGTKTINDIPVGDLFSFKGMSAGMQLSDGVEQCYMITFTTTMPKDAHIPVNVFAGIRSYQNYHLYYTTEQFTLESDPLKPTMYTYNPTSYDKAQEGYDFEKLTSLPLDKLIQNPLESLSSDALSEEQRGLIEWLIYLGYPYDNSHQLSGYMAAASHAITSKLLSAMKRYDNGNVQIKDIPGPVRDYYRMTQEAIWKVLHPDFNFSTPDYSYEENERPITVQLKDAGPRLLDLAREHYAKYGALSDYLNQNNLPALKSFLYNPIQDRSLTDTNRMFISMDAACKDLSDIFHVKLKHVDEEGSPLSNGEFTLYKGAHDSQELAHPEKLQVVETATSHEGDIDLGLLESHKLYTLAQTKAPDGLHKMADPVVFEAASCVKVDVHKQDESMNLNKSQMDFSDFNRLRPEPTFPIFYAYKASSLDKLGEPFLMTEGDPNEKRLNVKTIGYEMTDPMRVVNERLHPGVLGQITVGNSKAEFDPATQLGQPLELEYSNPFFTKDKVGATIFYKELDPTQNHHVVAQLYKRTDSGLEAVGNVAHTTLAAEDIVAADARVQSEKLTAAAPANSEFLAAEDRDQTSYDQNHSLYIDLGTKSLDTGEYLVKAVLVPEHEYSQIMGTPAEKEQVLRNLLESKDSSAHVLTPKDFPALSARVKVLNIPLTAVREASQILNLSAVVAGLGAIGIGALALWVYKRRMRSWLSKIPASCYSRTMKWSNFLEPVRKCN